MNANPDSVVFIIDDKMPIGKIFKPEHGHTHINLQDYFGYLIASFGLTKGVEMACDCIKSRTARLIEKRVFEESEYKF